jgi:purine-binding chemotaxis protein CheW
VITRNSKGELWGIAVDEPPNLLELPLEMMRSLPSSERHGKGILDRVSHAAIISQEEVTTTIFLLDLNQAINTATNDSSSITLARVK